MLGLTELGIEDDVETEGNRAIFRRRRSWLFRRTVPGRAVEVTVGGTTLKAVCDNAGHFKVSGEVEEHELVNYAGLGLKEQEEQRKAVFTDLKRKADRQERLRQVRSTEVNVNACLALPGTVQGETGYYEVWDERARNTVVAQFSRPVKTDGRFHILSQTVPDFIDYIFSGLYVVLS